MENQKSYPGPHQQQNSPEYKASLPNPMASASLVTGILALITSFYFPHPIILGASSIILAILSRKESPLKGAAKAGIIISIIAFIVSSLLLITFYGLGTSKEFYYLYLEYESDLEQTQINHIELK